MFGTGEILVILCVVLILFGGKKLPEFAKYLGQGILEFKKACQGINDNPDNINESKKETIGVEVKRDDHDHL